MNVLSVVDRAGCSGAGRNNAGLVYMVLVALSFAGAIGSLVIPWWVSLPVAATAIIFGIGLVKPEITFYLTILVMIEELCQLVFVFQTANDSTYTVRFFVYTIPLLATFSGLCVKFAKNDLFFKRTPLDGLLVIILSYQFISISWVPGHTMSALVFLNLLMNLVFYFVTTNIINNDRVLKQTVYIVIVTGLINVSGIIASMFVSASHDIWITDSVGLIFEFTSHNNRPGGFGGANHAAAFTNFAFFCALGALILSKTKRKKMILITTLLFMAAGVILTQSRGAFIGLAGAMVFYILINLKIFKRPLFVTISAMVILLSLVVIVKPSFLERVMIGFGYQGTLYLSQKDSFSGDESISADHPASISGMSARKAWWMNALNEMMHRPAKLFFGLGCGGYLYYAQGSPEVNSIYFSFIYDMGIFGLILMLLVATLLVSNLYTYLSLPEISYAKRMLFSFTAAMVSIIVIHGLIEFDLSSFGSKLIWFILALSMAAVNIIKNECDRSLAQNLGSGSGSGSRC